MDDYKSNSNKSKEKTIDKVVTGAITIKQKSEFQKFKDFLIGRDLRSVFKPILYKAIDDAVKNGIHTILYGSPEPKTHNRTGISPSYRDYYSNDRDEKPVTSRKSLYSFDSILFDDISDAHDVKDAMVAILEEYGTVSVAEMYDLVGIAKNYTDNNYGWNDMKSAKVIAVENTKGETKYTISLPRALPIK